MRPIYWLDRHVVTPALMLADNVLSKSWQRKWWQTRDRWQVWIWSGHSIPRRLARHLPLYFSDPDWMTNRQIRRVIARSAPVETVGPPSGIRVTKCTAPLTSASGTSQTYSVTFPPAA